MGGILYLGVTAVLYPTARTKGLDHVNYQPLFLVVSGIMIAAVAVLLLTIKEPKLAKENPMAMSSSPSTITKLTSL